MKFLIIDNKNIIVIFSYNNDRNNNNSVNDNVDWVC